MASEILAVQEERIPEVIKVLRLGIAYFATSQEAVSEETLTCLMGWCNDMERYMRKGENDEAPGS